MTSSSTRPTPPADNESGGTAPVPTETDTENARAGAEGAAGAVVVRISPMAHLASGFLALGILIPVQAWPLAAPLLAIPVMASVAISRLRTTATESTVTTRTLSGGESVGWDDVDGLRFHRGSWARAHLKDGRQLRLPAVTFATLPRLAAVSGGRVPNPYR